MGKGVPEYRGDFKTWKDAVEHSSGYDDLAIFEKVKSARLAVLRGEKAYERDSVLFDSVQYFWPVVASLLWIASRENNSLRILDFGGSLGSSYFQNGELLKHLSLSWSIVEQKHFVEFGQKNLSSKTLKFYDTPDKCFLAEKPNVALFSSVIQYLEKPYELLAEFKAKKIKYIIFDRTTFLESVPDRMTVQYPPKKIYDTTFPAWFFNLAKFKQFFETNYELIAMWPSIGDPIPLLDTTGRNEGMLFKIRT